MARIDRNNFSKGEKERYLVHDTAKATYCVFSDGGKEYFQIDTYGSTNREFPDRITQSLQIDKETCKMLIDILRQELNIN